MADSLVQRVGEILHRYNMLPDPGCIGVAVSGGADSVVLLHLLHRLRDRSRSELAVLHVNHQLRGAESDAEEEFVRTLAQSLGTPFYVEREQLPDGNLEQVARDARRAFFARLRSGLGLQRVALGHTKSDQAETVLYRFLRGSGTAGLAAMRPVTRDGIIRPLLELTRAEIREWARAEGISWREDSSNGDVRFIRNRLRMETLPTLTRDFNPALEGVLAGTALVAQGEEDYWAELASATHARITKRTQLGSFFQIADLNDLPLALRRRVLRTAIAELRGGLRGIDLQHIEAVLQLGRSVEGHDRVMIPGVDAVRSYGTLLVAAPGKLNEGKRHFRLEIVPGEPVALPFGLGTIRLTPTINQLQNCATVKIGQTLSEEIAYLNSDVLRGPICVRNWEPGDGFRRPGHRGFEKLKSLFQEHRILLWERRHWPVLTVADPEGDRLIWARGFGASAEATADPGSANVVRLEFSNESPNSVPRA